MVTFFVQGNCARDALQGGKSFYNRSEYSQVMGFIETTARKCRKDTLIAYPEATEERILRAAAMVAKKRVGTPVLFGDPTEVRKAAERFGVSLKGMRVVDANDVPAAYVKEYVRLRKKPARLAEHILESPLYHTCMAVRKGDAHTMVAGAATASADVVCAATHVIGLDKGILTPSSVFIMDVPKHGLLLFSDCAAVINPCADTLADIAITTARTCKALLGVEPRVAMLSFSTKGSASDPLVDKVVEATRIANKKAPRLKIDGEMQGDTALVPKTAKKKIKGPIGPVAGRANALVFPDINAGNICYKLVHVLAGAEAYGPLLQGFRRPVSDLSRGATPQAIYGTSVILSAWSGARK
jgi:phosphate acetyltransferase